MELRDWPQTQMEYWVAIEELGGFIWRTNHNFAHGRISESEELKQELKEAQEIQKKLVSEIAVKFGVVGYEGCSQVGQENAPPAPEGQICYWDWYNKMKREVYEEAYNKIICSACALSEGLDEFTSRGKIPCGVFMGSLYRLSQPHKCVMLEHWLRRHLFVEICNKGGEEAVHAFEKKEKELKGPCGSERLLALYPDLVFNREVARKVLVDKCWSNQVDALDKLADGALLEDLLFAFIHDSSAEEFLWYYIEAITGKKDIHLRVY